MAKNYYLDGSVLDYNDPKRIRHRVDGPAIEYVNGGGEWFLNGHRHRNDGPAVEWICNHKEWWQNGLLHRLDGPAVEYSDGTKEWYQNGLRHRLDGPAIDYYDAPHWYIYGQELTEEEFEKTILIMQLSRLLDG